MFGNELLTYWYEGVRICKEKQMPAATLQNVLL